MPVFISQSLIKKMVVNGNVIDHCPAYLYWVHVVKKYRDQETLPMMLGKLFEHKALGIPGRSPSVPRNQKTGKETEPHKRTLLQAEKFKYDAKELEIFISPEFNTQVTVLKRWEKDNRIILKGVFDLFPTVFKTPEGLELNIIDLKLTGNIKSTFGPFSWGNPMAIDHIQGVLYWYLVQDIDFELNDKFNSGNYLRDIMTDDVLEAIRERAYSFRYMIYDFSPQMNSQIMKVEISPDRIYQMHESIRKTVEMLEEYNRLKWPTYPHNSCKDCPVLHCKDRKMEIVV